MKWVTSSWMALIVLLGLVGLRYEDPFLIETARLKTFDYYQKLQTPHLVDNLVLIDLGEEHMKEFGQWPWPRDRIAKIITHLYNEGAGLVVLNFVFPEKDRMGKDWALALAMENVPTILTQVASPRATGEEATPRGLAYKGNPFPYLYSYKGAVMNIKQLADKAVGVGMVSTVPEIDGVVRRMPLAVRVADAIYPSLPIEVLRVAIGSRTFQIKTEQGGITKVRVKGMPIIQTDPHASVFIDYTPIIPRNTQVKGKIVFVGLVAEGLTQPVATPFGPMDTHELNAKAFSTIVAGKSIQRYDYADLAELLFILGIGVVIIFVLSRVSVKWTVPVMILFVSGTAYGGFFAFDKHNQLWDASYPLFAILILYIQVTFNNFAREFRLKQQIKKQFGTYLSPAMVLMLQKNPELLKLGGETKELSILFADIRGFTPISEQYKTDPQGLTSLINRFLTPMTDLIMNNNGTIDKYMGDCIMAFWNAPLDVKDHKGRALSSALDMVERLKELNVELEEENKLPINIGIGINTGEVVVGNMGSDNRFDYSILGDAANLASRLEGQSKGYGVTIILGEETVKDIEEEYFCVELDMIAVKGKEDAVRIFTVLGKQEYVKSKTDWEQLQQQHNKIFLESYRQQSWDLVIKWGTLLAENWPEMSCYYNIMIERAKEFKNYPIEENWDGVYRAKSK